MDLFELLRDITSNFDEILSPSDPVDKLILLEDAFHWSPQVEDLFLEAMRAAYRNQMERFPEYLKGVEVARKRGFAKYPDEISSSEDLKYILPVSVWTLKRMEFKDVSGEEPVLTLKSSGTSGMRSQIKLSKKSLARILKIVFNIFSSYGMTSQTPTNYLFFSYEIRKGFDIGTAFSDASLSLLTPVNDLFWAFKWDEASNDFRFDLEATIKALKRFKRDWEEKGIPLRILGFPAYIWFTLQEVEKELGKGFFRFGGDSWVITGGGWKTLEDKAIPKPLFRRKVKEILGIEERRVRDLFGMVEHGIPYLECENWEFHVPIYSRVLALDPGYGYQPKGKLGLLHFLTPYIDSYPSISLISSDGGSVSDSVCGRSSPRLVYLGRAGKLELRGCAIDALRLLERVKEEHRR